MFVRDCLSYATCMSHVQGVSDPWQLGVHQRHLLLLQLVRADVCFRLSGAPGALKMADAWDETP